MMDETNGVVPKPAVPKATTIRRKAGGWKAMPYILGNETFERLATFGLLANFMVYLVREYHMDQVAASNIINVWMGITNFAPLVGAFVSDAYVGRFRTIAFASFAAVLGMLMMTLTAWLPHLHPPQCTAHATATSAPVPLCSGSRPTGGQLGFLFVSLGLLSIGTGGIRPCSIPFGIDQFDPTTEDGARGINSYYNWYYLSFTVVILITQTVVVYIQDSVSWVIGFGIPTFLMLCSIILFFVGMRIYVHAKPEGSIFTGIVQVFMVAYRKRHLNNPNSIKRTEKEAAKFYDPPLEGTAVLWKLPLTDRYRFLNKAAIIVEGDLTPEGSPTNRWTLCSIQQVEEVKCLLKICPIWASGIVSFTSIVQQGTFTISQALKMDRRLGPKFQIPAGSLSVISSITVGLWLPLYDRILVPALRKVTKHEGGITLLQRIGIGIVFSVMSMVVAGIVERDRRSLAISSPQSQMSVMWLAPQLILMGLCEAFNIIGQIEFFNRQFPDHMRSIGNALFFCSFAGASYLSSFVATVVHRATRRNGHPDWLAADINAGRLDYYYFLLAGMGVLNLVYFLYCAYRYHYKITVGIESKTQFDVELSSEAKF